MALSHALLRGVAAGELPETARVFLPGPTLAFGRLDRLEPGYDRARAAAAEHGRTPVLRLGGGRAAGYDQESVVVELVTGTASVAEGIQERFRDAIGIVGAALAALGVPTVVGELEGAYCPGAWSLHLPGGPKVAGTAQRSIPGASLTTTVVVVGGGDRLRDVLVDVYAALGLAWRPATAGAVDDGHAAVTAPAVAAALEQELRGSRGARAAAVRPETLAAARALLPAHA